MQMLICDFGRQIRGAVQDGQQIARFSSEYIFSLQNSLNAFANAHSIANPKVLAYQPLPA
jgi:hypothetical protein